MRPSSSTLTLLFLLIFSFGQLAARQSNSPDAQRLRQVIASDWEYELQHDPELATASTLARSFPTMVRGGDGSGLDARITSAAESELSGLATGVARDKAAVAAAITEPWSTSPVERQIDRLKTLKRSVYGWAGYDVLRARMLAA